MTIDEERIWLRVKVPAEDGTAVMEMTDPVVPENGLQAFGAGCWPRLSSAPTAPQRPRAAWSPALRERSWEGDDVLANQLEAWLGSGVVRDLRPLPVDLDKLADILDFAGYSPQRQRLIGYGRCVRSPEPGRMRSRKSRTVGFRRARTVRTWHAARVIALGPDLAATPLARRPYDLRHAALSLWLNAGGEPAQIAARVGNSVHVLLTVYTHCTHGHDQLLNQHITTPLQPPATESAPGHTQRRQPAMHPACTRQPPRVHPRSPRSGCPHEPACPSPEQHSIKAQAPPSAQDASGIHKPSPRG